MPISSSRRKLLKVGPRKSPNSSGASGVSIHRFVAFPSAPFATNRKSALGTAHTSKRSREMETSQSLAFVSQRNPRRRPRPASASPSNALSNETQHDLDGLVGKEPMQNTKMAGTAAASNNKPTSSEIRTPSALPGPAKKPKQQQTPPSRMSRAITKTSPAYCWVPELGRHRSARNTINGTSTPNSDGEVLYVQPCGCVRKFKSPKKTPPSAVWSPQIIDTGSGQRRLRLPKKDEQVRVEGAESSGAIKGISAQSPGDAISRSTHRPSPVPSPRILYKAGDDDIENEMKSETSFVARTEREIQHPHRDGENDSSPQPTKSSSQQEKSQTPTPPLSQESSWSFMEEEFLQHMERECPDDNVSLCSVSTVHNSLEDETPHLHLALKIFASEDVLDWRLMTMQEDYESGDAYSSVAVGKKRTTSDSDSGSLLVSIPSFRDEDATSGTQSSTRTPCTSDSADPSPLESDPTPTDDDADQSEWTHWPVVSMTPDKATQHLNYSVEKGLVLSHQPPRRQQNDEQELPYLDSVVVVHREKSVLSSIAEVPSQSEILSLRAQVEKLLVEKRDLQEQVSTMRRNYEERITPFRDCFDELRNVKRQQKIQEEKWNREKEAEQALIQQIQISTMTTLQAAVTKTDALRRQLVESERERERLEQVVASLSSP